MAGTILPIVYGECARGQLAISVWLYALGLLSGAVVLGGALGTLGSELRLNSLLTPAAGALVIIAACAHLGYAAREFELCRLPMPQSLWQVPRRWQNLMSARSTSLIYGVALGLGVLTRIPTSTFYIVLVWVVIAGNHQVGFAVLGIYGIGRAVPVIALQAATQDFEHAAGWLERLTPWYALMRLVNGFVLASSGGWLLGLELFQGLK